MAVVLLDPLLWLVDTILGIAIAIVFAAIIASWLVALGVLNLSNPLARQIMQILDGLTEPVFRRVRRVVPPIGGLDFSPAIVLIALWFLRMLLERLLVYIFLQI